MSKLVDDSRGRHALLAVLDEKTQGEVEEETKVPQGSLSLISTQKRMPGLEVAGRLTKIGIEYAWWAQPPTREQLKRDAERQAAKEPAA